MYSVLRIAAPRVLAAAASGTALAAAAPYYSQPAEMAKGGKRAPVPEGRKGWVVTPLYGKVAVVTGSAQGIGAGIAQELAWAGADVCINHFGTPEAAEDCAEDIRAIGRRAIVVEADVADRAAIDRMFDRCEEELGPVDILVTNAITSSRASLIRTKPEDFERTLRIGLIGVASLSNACPLLDCDLWLRCVVCS